MSNQKSDFTPEYIRANNLDSQVLFIEAKAAEHAAKADPNEEKEVTRVSPKPEALVDVYTAIVVKRMNEI